MYDLKNIYFSYVGSCNEIAVLSSLASEIISNSNQEQPLHSLFAKLNNGHYIMLPKSSSLQSNTLQSDDKSFDGNYRLEYCNFDSTRKLLSKSSRESISNVNLKMYKYVYFDDSNICFIFMKMFNHKM